MTRDLKDLPIGVFDSGLGGLTVVQAIRHALPAEKILYLGDSARVPYGTRSAGTVIRYAQKCAEFLVGQGLKMLAVACNTASAVALPALRAETDMPVLGVITAGARAVTASGASRIGVIGTAGTIRSGAYSKEIAALAPECDVIGLPAPLFVPLAEEGWIDGEVPLLAARTYLEPLAAKNIDVLLLGCTHYPLLVSPIKAALKQLECRAQVVDSATAMGADIKRVLGESDLRRAPDQVGDLKCFVTDLPDSFEVVATRFLGNKPGEVKLVDI
ncbi:MAG: glutamate racemase [Deltaproteobacteria bacterium]|nr:glutamate racemase [Deltaproteobacteria bacterium]